MNTNHQFKFINSLYLFKNVIWALFIKEIKVRFSNKGYLTYFWILGEPLFQIGFFIILFAYIFARASRFGLPIQLVVLTGIVPFQMFSGLISKSMGAVDANQALLAYKQISIFSTIITRTCVEAFLTVVTFIFIYSLYCSFGLYFPIHNILLFVTSFILLIIFTVGISFMTCVLGFFFPDSKVVIQIIIRFAYFFSGTIFDISILPHEYQKILLYNPVLQAITLIRRSFVQYDLPSYGSVSLSYLFMSSMITLFLGLLVYFTVRDEFIKQARART